MPATNLNDVIPRNGGPWYKQSHLVRLNFCISSLFMFSSANGFDGSLMNGLQALKQWNHFMGSPSGAWLGFINVSYWITVGLASPVVGWATNKYGRKPPLYAGYVFLVIATALQTGAQDPAMFIAARFLLGPATACFGNAAPLLVAELAYPTHRGVLTALSFCGFYVGTIIAAWTVFGSQYIPGDWAWRCPSLMQVFCPLLALPGLYFCSESPRWLVSVDRAAEARVILAKTHTAGADVSSPLVEFELAEIEKTIQSEADAQASSSYTDMLKTRGNRRRLLITLSLGFFSQWVGNGVVSYYLALMLDTVGVTSTRDQTLISACLQIWNLLLSAGAALLVDRLGRRLLFLSSFVIMLVSYVAITGLSASFASTGASATGLAVVPLLFIYFAGYDIALTPLLVAYPVEIWPYHLRSRGVSLVWVTLVIAVVFNTFVNPIALAAIGWKYYIVFVVVIFAYGITVFLCYSETRNHTLEEISIIFDKDNSVLEGWEMDTSETPNSTDKGADVKVSDV